MANWSIRLTTRGNPDFQQYAPITDPETLTADTLPELRDKIKEWKSDWTVGGGNWMMPLVRKDGAPVGYMSYNGRLWNQEFMDTDHDAQKKKYGEYFPKQLQITGDDPEPMVLVSSELLDSYGRREDILEDASRAFWTSVASHFPEGTSGDMSPYNNHVIEKAMRKAINIWIDTNYSSEEAYEIEEWHRETD